MAMELDGSDFSDSSRFMDARDTTTKKYLSKIENRSVPEGCVEVSLNASGYIPWDNPDNIVSAEVAAISLTAEHISLALMLVFGGPANVINMAVFHKQGLNDRVNLCLFALSLSDLLYLISATMIESELVVMRFISKDQYGKVDTFLINHNFIVLYGFQWISQVLTAIIASERCFCVLYPLKFQTLFRTRTMFIIILTVYIAVLGLFFVVAFLYRIGCVYDPVSDTVLKKFITGKFYENHKELVDYLNGFVFGIGLPGVVIIVVTTATIITAVKLHHVRTWRAGTSSSLSEREVALTKMLVANSILFIACVTPDGLFRIICFFLPEMNIGRRNHNLYMSFLQLLDITTYINASFNIFVFYAMGSRYRENFWALLKRNIQQDKLRK